jgi:hypothetical protein
VELELVSAAIYKILNNTIDSSVALITIYDNLVTGTATNVIAKDAMDTLM